MRRSLFLFCTLLACLSAAYAQTRIPRELHIGAVGGVNASQYVFFPRCGVPQQNVLSHTAGLAVRYIEETLFGLQAELLLTQRAYSDFYEDMAEGSEPQPGTADIYYSRYLNYIELPVMAHVYFQMGAHNEICFDAGPKFGFYLSDRIDTNIPRETDLKKHHFLPVTQNFDYGIQAGLGYEFKFNKKISLMLQGRYYYGLGNIWPETKADDFQQSSNQSIQVVMSLWWHHTILGKRIKR